MRNPNSNQKETPIMPATLGEVVADAITLALQGALQRKSPNNPAAPAIPHVVPEDMQDAIYERTCNMLLELDDIRDFIGVSYNPGQIIPDALAPDTEVAPGCEDLLPLRSFTFTTESSDSPTGRAKWLVIARGMHHACNALVETIGDSTDYKFERYEDILNPEPGLHEALAKRGPIVTGPIIPCTYKDIQLPMHPASAPASPSMLVGPPAPPLGAIPISSPEFAASPSARANEASWAEAVRRRNKPTNEDDPTGRRTLTVLLVAGVDAATIEMTKSWNEEQRRLAEEWAVALHYAASDNEDVVVPPKPDFVPEIGEVKATPSTPSAEPICSCESDPYGPPCPVHSKLHPPRDPDFRVQT